MNSSVDLATVLLSDSPFNAPSQESANTSLESVGSISEGCPTLDGMDAANVQPANNHQADQACNQPTEPQLGEQAEDNTDQTGNQVFDQQVELERQEEVDLGSSSGEIESDEESSDESSVYQSEMELSDYELDKKDVKLVLKTKNEIQDLPPIEKINVEIPMQEPLLCVGKIEKIIQDNLIIVAADNSGDYQVLDMDSVILSKDKRPIGKIFEVFGRVSQPLYSVRINGKEEIEDLGLEVNTPVYYIQNLVQMVFTQPLKAQKGSDASNLHDEEIGAHELEFSDDEKEAEHKRLTKKRKIKTSDSVAKAAKPQFSAQNHGSNYSSNQAYTPQYQYQQYQYQQHQHQLQPSSYDQYIQQYNQYQYQMMHSGYNYNYQTSQYPYGFMQPAYPPAYQMGMPNNYLQQSQAYTPQNVGNNQGNNGGSTTHLGSNQEEEISLYDNIKRNLPQ